MVKGLELFKKGFRDFEDQYVIIGGTACDSNFRAEKKTFRVTKDIDLVLIVEALTAEFVRRFWAFVKDAGYEHKNKSTGNVQFYRFSCPENNEYPYMIELFSRNPAFIELKEDAVLTPLPVDDEISSLSAIVLNESYYALLKHGRVILDGIPFLNPPCLIAFKAKAYLDLKKKNEEGFHVDSTTIKKHKNDVYRLSTLLKEYESYPLEGEVACDMKSFILKMWKEDIDLKSLGIKTSKKAILELLEKYFTL